MPQRPPVKQAAPTEILTGLNGGYDGYTDPTQAPWKRWAQAVNVFSGAFGYLQRCRFANVIAPNPTTGQPFTTLKYFALPGLSSYLIADINGLLYSYDTGNNYAQTPRLNPYVDPAGAGSSLLNGPWSRESLGNILYEMNGQVKQAGRLANAATIEGWGLDAPDATPQVAINATVTTNISAIARSNGVVTVTVAATGGFFGGGTGTSFIGNVSGVTDLTYNGSFTLTIVNPTTFTYPQIGQNTSSSGGTVNLSVTKAVGRSYAYAWENANKSHVGAISPVTQYIQYNAQYGVLTCTEPGTISASIGSPIITGVGTFFTSAWVGRSIWYLQRSIRIVSVQSATQLTLASNSPINIAGTPFVIFDPQATHIRLYATSDGGATYFRIARNVFDPTQLLLANLGVQFTDAANAEPPNFPYTTETAQVNNLPPPVGTFINHYQGRLCVFLGSSFFYSNVESTTIGLPQESYAPLNQVTLPIQNATLNGMLEFPGSAIIWSNKQDMFRLTGLLTDNTIQGVAAANAASQQGASISQLPYDLGCASPYACELTPLGGIWLTPNSEVWLFTDRYAPRNIGRPVQDILSSISPSQIGLARMKYYHTQNRNWLVLAIPANSGTFNNTLLILDLDLLASNGSPSYFTFDMATNAPCWFVFQPGRCDSLESVYENNGNVRLLTNQIDQIQDVDYISGGFGTEIPVSTGTVTLHAWGNDSAFVIKRPKFVRFNTNRDPSMLATDGWNFQVLGIDDDFYTFFNPLALSLVPGVNDSSTLGGNPDFSGGLAFRHSPELYMIGGVNFVMGRRLKFQVNFPSGTGVNYQLRGIQMGFGANPPN